MILMRISQALPHVATNKPQLHSAQPFLIHWTTSPSCNCVLGRSCQFGENGNASKDLGCSHRPKESTWRNFEIRDLCKAGNCMHFYRSHPQNISQGCAPLQQKFLFKQNLGSGLCFGQNLPQRQAGRFSTCMFCRLFRDIGHKLRMIPLSRCTCLHLSFVGSLHGRRIDNIPCTSYFVSKHRSWSSPCNPTRQTKKTLPKSTDYQNPKHFRELKPHVITCHHNNN